MPLTRDVLRPVNRPVKTYEPRGLLLVRLSSISRLKSTPQRRLCLLYIRDIESPKVTVCVFRSDGVMSRRPEKVENETDGTPQSNGSVDTPVTPASPATSVT